MTIKSILHPTDFFDLSGAAFAHALRIALAAKSKLHVLHVEQRNTCGAQAFPQVRQLLVQWGFADENEPSWIIASRLGIEVDKTLLTGQDPTVGILGFLRESPRHLIVFATGGRHGGVVGSMGLYQKLSPATQPGQRYSLRQVHPGL